MKKEQIKDFKTVGVELSQMENLCRNSGQQYEECCTAEGYCWRWEAEKEEMKSEIDALFDEINNEAEKSYLRKQQRMNADK